MIIWHSDYYDGPLTGLCQYKGRTVWFKLADESPTDYYIYNLYSLTDQQLSILNQVRSEFRRYVGKNCEYENGKRNFHTHPKSEWAKFYDNKDLQTLSEQTKREIEKEKPIGSIGYLELMDPNCILREK